MLKKKGGDSCFFISFSAFLFVQKSHVLSHIFVPRHNQRKHHVISCACNISSKPEHSCLFSSAFISQTPPNLWKQAHPLERAWIMFQQKNRKYRSNNACIHPSQISKPNLSQNQTGLTWLNDSYLLKSEPKDCRTFKE